MACAKKCDRCGKLYEQYSSKNDRKNPNEIMVSNLDAQRKYYSHGAIDLCPGCMKEFQDWMEEVKQMERLTKLKNGRITYNEKRDPVFECGEFCDNCPTGTAYCRTMKKMIRKLADYEDLEEQGLLVRLPCKEAYAQSGDYVYLIDDCEIVKCVHCGLGIDPLSGTAYITLATDEKIFPYRNPDPEQDLDPTDWCTNAIDVKASEIDKTVFLTREEAEKKLEEMKNGL